MVQKGWLALHSFFLFYHGSYCASFTIHSGSFGVQGLYEMMRTHTKLVQFLLAFKYAYIYIFCHGNNLNFSQNHLTYDSLKSIDLNINLDNVRKKELL